MGGGGVRGVSNLCVEFKDTSKWSQFCHLVLKGECLYVVFTH